MAMCMKASRVVAARPARSAVKCQASMPAYIAKAAGLGLASLGLALSAQAATVKMGADSGALVFEPNAITIKSGETVDFLNNVAGPHNVVFDEDAVPGGVSPDDADALSIAEPVNAPGAVTTVGPFNVAGTYNYYCEPHKASGMVGSIVVE